MLGHLRRQPNGMTSGELAEVLGVDASTIRRDLARLRVTDAGLRRRGRRYVVDFQRAQRPLRLSADEVMALYLACRLLTRQQGDRNPHAEAAMRKLADTVRDDAPRLARYLDDAAVIAHTLPLRAGFQSVLEVLTHAISDGHIVTLRYHDRHGVVSERRFHPYAVEPFGETHSCYAIGFDETRGAIRTFRLDRIENATLTADPFELPPSFDPSTLFAEAWGVVWSEAETQLVTLRFVGEGAVEVQERSWHPSQRIVPHADGSCVVSFRVSAPLELRRWILQWGVDVEVVAPPELRAAIAGEATRIARRAAEAAEATDEDVEHRAGDPRVAPSNRPLDAPASSP
ncbi:MAG TPA: WYL domain-containing protein [Nitrolancea sp.]|nr:WYL domain-containing protein [Nitrolancea sp.]